MDLRQLRLVLPICLCVMSFVAFGPVLQADFLAWDDPLNILDVEEIRALGAENLRWMFFDFGPDIRYKPITYLAWAVLHAIGGMKPFLFHLANLVMHTINGCLLIYVLHRLGNLAAGKPVDETAQAWRWQAAVVVALLWTVHPLRVETSAWVSVLSYSLAVFFLLLAVLCFLACDREQSFFRQAGYWGALLLFQLGMMCFPTAIGFSFAFLGLLIFPLRLVRVDTLSNLFSKPSRQAMIAWAPFFALTVLMVIVGLYGQHVKKGIWGDPLSLEELSASTRALGSCYFLAYYGWRPFYPFKMFTLNEDLVGMTAAQPRVIAAIVLIVVVSAWACYRRRSSPALFAVFVAFVGTTFPVLKITGGTPFPGPGDRYSLIIGLAWIAGVYGLVLRYREHPWRNRILGALALITIIFTIQSRHRSAVWENDITFFSDQTRTLRSNVYRGQAFARLAQALFAAERYEEGLHACERAWQLIPVVTAAQVGARQGKVLLDLGREQEAIAILQRSRQFAPTDGNVLQLLGSALFHAGDPNGGMQAFQELIAAHPDDPKPYFVTAATLAGAGHHEVAINLLDQGIQKFPNAAPLQQLRQQIASSPR